MLASVENCGIKTLVAACRDYGGHLNNFLACAKDKGVNIHFRKAGIII
jgi:hypothetical protein